VPYGYGQETTISRRWDILQTEIVIAYARWDDYKPQTTEKDTMNDYELNTSYVSGMTKIPQRTIQEYIKTFRDHFSERARQTVKGRRFLPADIDKLQLIKRLRAERVTDDEIKSYLSGEAKLPEKLAHQFKDSEIKDMAAHSLEIFGRAEYVLEQSEKQINQAHDTLSAAQRELMQTRQEIQVFRNQLNRVEGTLEKFRQWQLFVMKADPLFNPYAKDDPGEPMPEKKGIIGKLLGG
jgi:DNA-binding transcriptional MerR regulator